MIDPISRASCPKTREIPSATTGIVTPTRSSRIAKAPRHRALGEPAITPSAVSHQRNRLARSKRHCLSTNSQSEMSQKRR